MEVILIVSVVGTLVAFAVFPDQSKRFIRAIAAGCGRLAQVVAAVTGTGLRTVWGVVAPVQRVSVFRAAVGLTALAVAVGVLRANFALMAPTVRILLPIEQGTEALALALVLLPCVLGALFHLCPDRRALVAITAAMLAFAASWLAWYREAAIQVASGAEPDLFACAFVAAITLTIQLAEITLAGAALSLAGDVIAVILAVPILLALGSIWVPSWIAVGVQLDVVAADAMVALIDACARGRDALRSLGRWLSHPARHARHQAKLLTGMQSAYDRKDLEAVLSERHRSEVLRLEHEASLRAMDRDMEREILRNFSDVMKRGWPGVASELFAAIAMEIKRLGAQEVKLAAPAAAKDVVDTTLAGIRGFNYFNLRAKRETTSEPKNEGSSQTVN